MAYHAKKGSRTEHIIVRYKSNEIIVKRVTIIKETILRNNETVDVGV